MKKLLLILLLFISFTAFSQSGWQYGNRYQYRGDTWTEYSWSHNVQYYRTVVWHREQREGFQYQWVYDRRWNSYRWEQRWYSGWSWYYTWSPWYPTHRR